MTQPGPGGPSEGKVSFQVPLPLGRNPLLPELLRAVRPAPLRNSPRRSRSLSGPGLGGPGLAPPSCPAREGRERLARWGDVGGVGGGARSAISNVLLGDSPGTAPGKTRSLPSLPSLLDSSSTARIPAAVLGEPPTAPYPSPPRRHGRFWDGPGSRGAHDRSPHPERLPRQAAPAGRRCARRGRARPGTRGRREPAAAPAGAALTKRGTRDPALLLPSKPLVNNQPRWGKD